MDEPNKENNTNVNENSLESNRNKKQPKKKIKRFLLVLLLLLLFITVIGFLSGISKSEYDYSKDHNKVFKTFGNPDSFTIMWDPETNSRLETWHYINLGETFSFKNGQFVHRQHNDFNLDENAAGFSIDLEPKDFYNISNLTEIDSLLGTTPSTTGQINEDLLEATTSFYSYDNWIQVGVLSNKIVYVTKNTKYADVIETDYGPSDVTEDLSNFVFKNETYGYTFKMGKYSEMIFEKPTDFGQDYDTYTYCYISFGASRNSLCGEDAFPIFSIDAMNKEQYQTNIIDDPFGEMYEELGKDSDYHFMYSHPNGDLPDDSPPPDFYEMVIDTFKVKENK